MTIVEQIVSREIDAAIVYESEHVIAFADHDPINFGHILICPVVAYETFIDLPEDIALEINRVAKDLYRRIEIAFQPDGISFIQNNGFFNDLSHYHLHIFPRFKDDQFGWVCSELGVQSVDKLRQMLVNL